MIQNFARAIFGTQNDRELKTIQPLIVRINECESRIQKMDNPQLQAQTQRFRERLDQGESIDALLPEAFATVREASLRVTGQRHYDVQMIGGVTLHRGKIAEMRTGEGKTLVATLPCYLNALTQEGVHVVTVNDYLARRDAESMGRIHSFLGLRTGTIVHGLNDSERKINYACDIVYGTNNEFGFDYLRDNMKFRLDDYVQRNLHFAIVDEVDSILIDEARTPLIISGPTEDSSELYYTIDTTLRHEGGLIKDKDYTIDEKSKTASLTDSGVEKMERRLSVSNLYDPTHIELLHHVNQGLRAHVLYRRDTDYVVKSGEVIIVDEFTGRLMPGRRWSDGLHQAIEAKEGVRIENENQTLATITFQNYFRMYKKLSGMTGTADTEAREFQQIYKLAVTVIPTNKPMIRIDRSDIMYKTETVKLKAIAEEIKRLKEKGQPVLVGTVSVEKSEKLSALLRQDNIQHHVLNAKQHDREAEIVAQAGRLNAITISTNMAGRGTDIVLGGNAEFLARHEVGPFVEMPTLEIELQKQSYDAQMQAAIEKWKHCCAQEREGVLERGGLFILGTERHESRRIDNQLRGRAGRQGDAGESRFYLCLDDDLMRIFAGVNISKYMDDFAPIEHKMINRSIETAQRKVEGHNYDVRKHLLEYDDVMNQQRQVIYAWRREVLSQSSLKGMIKSMITEICAGIAEEFFPKNRMLKKADGDFFSIPEFVQALNGSIATLFHTQNLVQEENLFPLTQHDCQQYLIQEVGKLFDDRETPENTEYLHQMDKIILLTTIDQLWKDHLLAMDHMRDGIGLQGYGQKDPLIEYKKQGFAFFQIMMQQIPIDVVKKIFFMDPIPLEPIQLMLTPDIQVPEVPKNALCPCGSGLKYKKCHGK